MLLKVYSLKGLQNKDTSLVYNVHCFPINLAFTTLSMLPLGWIFPAPAQAKQEEALFSPVILPGINVDTLDCKRK